MNDSFGSYTLADEVSRYFESELPDSIPDEMLDEVLAVTMANAFSLSTAFDGKGGDVRFVSE